MKKDFGIDLPAYESFSNTPQIMMRYTRAIHETLNAQVQKDPDVLVTEEAIQKLDEELNRPVFLCHRPGRGYHHLGKPPDGSARIS